MWNSGPTNKILQNKRSIHISGPQLNIIASMLDLLKISSEVVVGSKCGPLAKVEIGYVIKTGPTEKFL